MNATTHCEELTDWRTVAKRLGLCQRAFRKLVSQGLPHYRINNRVHRYRWSEIEQWLANYRRGE